MEYSFDHERLQVYRTARELNGAMRRLLKQVPDVEPGLAAALRAAAAAIMLGVAEGAGRWSLQEQLSSYHRARSSAVTCAARLDELVYVEDIHPEQVRPAMDLLRRTVGLLLPTIRSLEDRVRSSAPARRPRRRQASAPG